ncbi:hypothetical protein JCM12298_02130 [Desulfothermus naphthae]
MMDTFLGILFESFKLLETMALYLLFGFLVAGILKVLLPEEKIVSHFGRGKILSSLKASLVGIPLCSCGVLPAAVSFRKQGANKGATLSFLISTPTTGADSILAIYALLRPNISCEHCVKSIQEALNKLENVKVNLNRKKVRSSQN